MVTVKKKYPKKPTRLMKSESAFAGKFLKKGAMPAYKKVLKRRWWLGRMSNFKKG